MSQAPDSEHSQQQEADMSEPAHVEFLRRTTLADVINSKPQPAHGLLHALTPNATVDAALLFFQRHNLRAAPVVDPTRTHRSRYLGILSLVDLLIPIVNDRTVLHLSSLPSEKERAEYLACHPLAAFDMQVGGLLGMSEESAYPWSYEARSGLSDVMEILSHGVHRVLVFDSAGLVKSLTPHAEEAVYMLTQMDVVRFLVQHAAELGPLVKKSLTAVGLAPPEASFEHFHHHPSQRNIDHAYDALPSSSSSGRSTAAPAPPPPQKSLARRASVTERLRYLTSADSALAGFRSMHRSSSSPSADITALPVVDPHNFSLVATLSATDFRCVHREQVGLLVLPVLEFLREAYMLQVAGKGEAAGEGQPQQPQRREQEQRAEWVFQVVSKGEDALLKAMQEMVADRVHRAWVVDELGRPVGVVTLSDVVGKFSPFDAERERLRLGEADSSSERKDSDEQEQ